jgi:hypothetical protein
MSKLGASREGSHVGFCGLSRCRFFKTSAPSALTERGYGEPAPGANGRAYKAGDHFEPYEAVIETSSMNSLGLSV